MKSMIITLAALFHFCGEPACGANVIIDSSLDAVGGVDHSEPSFPSRKFLSTAGHLGSDQAFLTIGTLVLRYSEFSAQHSMGLWANRVILPEIRLYGTYYFHFPGGRTFTRDLRDIRDAIDRNVADRPPEHKDKQIR